MREEAIEDANIFAFDGIEVRVMLAEYLVADMLNVGRPKDLVRAKIFVDKNMIDLEALHTLLRRFEIEDKWQKFKQL